MGKSLFIVLLLIVGFGCSSSKNVAGASAEQFSLSGTWKLSATTDNNALVGTVISVGRKSGEVKTVVANNYCIAAGAKLWKDIKVNPSGGFTVNTLTSACDSNQYTAGTIAVVNNDKTSVTSRTSANVELVQAFDRVK